MRVVFLYVHDRFTPFSTAIAALAGAVRADGYELVRCGVPIGASVEEATERVVGCAPDVVAASFMSRDFPLVTRVLSEARRRTFAFVVAGGYHATLDAGSVARAGVADAIGVGEGERPFRRLLGVLAAGARPQTGAGLWVAEPGGGFAGERPSADREPDVDRLPSWDYELFADVATESSMYGWVGPDRYLPVRASRGCPFDCSYCSNPAWTAVNELRARGVRNVRSVDRLLDELVALRARFEPQGFEFWDEHFPIEPSWIEAFADAYPRRVGLPFRVEMHPNTARPERLATLARAGCALVHFGVESGDHELRRGLLKRRTSDAVYERIFAEARALGMETSASVMTALPGESFAMGERTLDLVRRLAPDHLSFAAYAPLPGTELGARASAAVGVGGGDRFESTLVGERALIEPDAMTHGEATRLLRGLRALQAELRARARERRGLRPDDARAGDEPMGDAALDTLRALCGEGLTLHGASLDARSMILHVGREAARATVVIEPRRPGARSFLATPQLLLSYRGASLDPTLETPLRALARSLGPRTFDELTRALRPAGG